MSRAYYSVKEAAVILFGEETKTAQMRVSRWIKNGHINAIRDGTRYWIPHSEFGEVAEIDNRFPKANSENQTVEKKNLQKPADRKSLDGIYAQTKVVNEMLKEENSDKPIDAKERWRDQIEMAQREFFADLKEKKIISYKDLAKALEVRQESVSRWSSGRSIIEVWQAKKMFDVIGYGDFNSLWLGFASEVQKKDKPRATTKEEITEAFKRDMKSLGFTDIKITASYEA